MKLIIALALFAFALALSLVYGSEKYVQNAELHVPIIIDGVVKA